MLRSNNLCSLTLPWWSDQPWETIIYSYSVPYIILLILAFMQGEEQCGYSKCAYSFIDQRLLASVQDNLAM